MSESLFLTVVVPAYNEERRLQVTLEAIDRYCRNLHRPCEILAVDDGSSDGTARLIKQLERDIPSLRLVSYGQNRGKGYAIRTGVLQAAGRFVLFSDADLSTPIEEMDRFLPLLIAGKPVVVATRKHPDARIMIPQSVFRTSMGKGFTWISNLLLGMRLTDFTCGFKAFHQNAARRIFEHQLIDRWAFDSEILFLARKFGYEIAEVPVTWTNSEETRVFLPRDTVTSFTALLKIRWNSISGKYAEAPLPVVQT